MKIKKQPIQTEAQKAYCRQMAREDRFAKIQVLFYRTYGSLDCVIRGCNFSTQDYKEFFRHLHDVHRFGYSVLPNYLARAIKKENRCYQTHQNKQQTA